MGMEKEVLRLRTGPKPVVGRNVTVHCTGFGKNNNLSQKFWRKDPGRSHSPSKSAKVQLLKDGMKVCWECKWEKLLVCGALRIMLMVLVGFLLGVFNLTPSLFSRLKS